MFAVPRRFRAAVWRSTAAICLASSTCFATPPADGVSQALEALAAVGPNGRGVERAREAANYLAGLDASSLPRVLDGLDTSNVLAANWCRMAYERIVSREFSRPAPEFPLEALRGFVGDARRQGRARRLVLKLLDRLEPEFGKQLVPALLDDPEFRPDAVRETLAAGDAAQAAGRVDEARVAYRRAFAAARESSQVLAAADKLQSVGETADPIASLGLVVDWHLIGPFDAPGQSGFDATFPPEAQVDLDAKYVGQNKQTIAWKPHHAIDRLGLIDLNRAIAPSREAVGYAYAVLDSPRDAAAQLRCGADDNCSVWLNGERVFARRQWLNGTRLDRFIVDVHLKAGRNSLLVKVCQGPQHKDPDVPNNWSLQLRLCDAEGAGLSFKTVAPAAIGEGAP